MSAEQRTPPTITLHVDDRLFMQLSALAYCAEDFAGRWLVHRDDPDARMQAAELFVETVKLYHEGNLKHPIERELRDGR